MSQPLVLSLFPGGGLLDYAFEQEGFCVVRGPDPLWGGDVRNFHPPAGRFDGVIGGDPCQEHTPLANILRAKGLEPSFPDLTPEYQRLVEEAQPAWFLRENVPGAPDLKPEGYDVRSFLLDNWASFGEEQGRLRRFWFGVHCMAEYPMPIVCPELRAHMNFALFVPPEHVAAVNGGHDGGGGAFTLTQNDPRRKRKTVTGRHSGAIGTTGGHAGKPGKYTLEEMLALQGLPEDWLEHQPWTMQAKRKIVGNGVAVPTGRQLAQAIRKALYEEGKA